MAIIKLLIGIGIISVMLISGGENFRWTLDLDYLVIATLINLYFLTVTNSIKKLITSFKYCLVNKSISRDSKETLLKLNNYLIYINILSGLIIFVMRKITMFSCLSDPSSIGPLSASTWVPFYYSLLTILLILIPMKYILSNLNIEDKCN
jgi:hypothetical protein